VSGAVHSGKGQLGVLPLGEVASHLLVHSVGLPGTTRHLVAKIPDPVLQQHNAREKTSQQQQQQQQQEEECVSYLSSNGGTHVVIVTREYQDVESEAPIDEVVVVRSHVVVSVARIVAVQQLMSQRVSPSQVCDVSKNHSHRIVVLQSAHTMFLLT
jgi:hypothetical protein